MAAIMVQASILSDAIDSAALDVTATNPAPGTLHVHAMPDDQLKQATAHRSRATAIPVANWGAEGVPPRRH